MANSHLTRNWLIFIGAVVVFFGLGMLANSVMNRKSEARFAYQPAKVISPTEPRNAVWGENFPRQYQSYQRTQDTTFVSEHGGSAMRDMLEDDPKLVVLWAGYGFAKDYNQGRGHYYSIKDIHNTLRTGGPKGPGDGPMPSTCWTCKSPDVPRLMNEHGIEEFYDGKWADKGSEVVNSIGCADCHDAKTMSLRISRPALVEAFDAMGKDINQSTHQEMRSLVCAQCHVEYYFNSKTPKEGVPYLTFPWKDGMAPEDMLAYYDNIGFSDWTHTISKAPMLKAQHPDYEVYMTGVHAKRGVSCADCHMPYISEGGQKYTNHHLQSPLNNVSNACQVCHREEAKSLIEDVFSRQDKFRENQFALEEMLVRAHIEAGKAWELGATDAQMEEILQGIRHAQWYWDYPVASHGGSFHSPVESNRVLAKGIAEAQEARLKLARLLADLGWNQEVPYPDIETKAKAQAFVGLDMPALQAEKTTFKKNIVPKWLEEAAAREAEWDGEVGGGR